MREVYAKQLADSSVAARRKLATELLTESKKAADNLSDQFVLLTGTIEAAREGSNVRLCFEAADLLAAKFDVDSLALKADAAARTNVAAAGSPAAVTENLQAALGVIDQLVAAEDYAAASRVCASLQAAANSDPASRALVQQRSRDIASAGVLREQATQAMERLRTNPTDAAANLSVGSYICFAQGEWPSGLPLLASGSNPLIKAAATADLAAPTEPPRKVAVGDAWWAAAEKATSVLSQNAMRQRAASLYREAMTSGQITGLNRIRLEKRLEGLPPPGSNTGKAKPGGLVIADLSAKLNDFNEWKVTQGEWTTAGTHFRGVGETRLEFNSPIPADCAISFRLNVVSGMRPRVYFHNSGIMFGNEGYEKKLFPHGVKGVEGEAFNYKNNEEHLISFRFSGETFEAEIDGKPVFKGPKKKCDAMKLTLRGGDSWSKGTTEFWDFQISRLK